MSRVARAPVTVPKGVTVALNNRQVNVKGSNGELALTLHELVELVQEDDQISVKPIKDSPDSRMHAATTIRLLGNMVEGVSNGFQKALKLIGVGYKAQVQGQKLTLNLGFSHPIEYTLPDGVSAETPSATDLVLKSADKQKLGQAAANIRSYRPPEPYKGKGVRYVDEHIVRKEAKKK